MVSGAVLKFYTTKIGFSSVELTNDNGQEGDYDDDCLILYRLKWQEYIRYRFYRYRWRRAKGE